MDNVTHTLVGGALAESALALRKKPAEPVVRAATWLTAGLASNAPDLDVLLTPLTDWPYGYLLHHRGHTHTLALAPLVALLAWGAGLWWARRKAGRDTAPRGFLFGVAMLGVLLHVAMDGANTYGVHPFWPLWNGWIASDSLFIVEPLLWIVLAIPLGLVVRSDRARLILYGIAGLAIVLEVVTGYVSSFGLAISLAAAGITYWVARRLTSPGRRAALSVFLAVVVVASFGVGRVLAEQRVRAVSDTAFPHAVEADAIVMPEPGNPLCWHAITVAEERDDLVLRRVWLSIAAFHPVTLCAMPPADETTAVRTPIARSETETLRFVDEVRTPLAVVRALAEDCRGEAFYRFARAPFVRDGEGGRFLGDLRYDRETDAGFAEAWLEEGQACPSFVPPWEPWRREILEGTLPPEEHRHEALDF